MENEWVKMFDPPTASLPTPERLAPTNPVPAFIAATVPGAKMSIPNTVRRTLMHGMDIVMWDGNKVKFFLFGDPDIPVASNGTFPAPTIRVPRGIIFHGETHAQGPPPHTIHWHGIEPTPMNDGVGHCSMELGNYTYQWQPNFIGSYFYHCHRNTMQHFEFGLYGFLIVMPPDAYQGLNGTGADDKWRTAANLTNFPQFPGFDPTPVDQLVAGQLNPHAMTVPYDVEALWVLDDRDSVWAAQMPDAKDTFPVHGNNPGVNDQFFRGDFHDFNPDYFFATGVPFMAHIKTPQALAAPLQNPAIAFGTPDGTVPAALNSGVVGMQVAVNAKVNQTILIRALCAAYAKIKITFPVDVVIIAFDGRALGVPPFGNYNSAFLLKKGVPFELTTARRFDVLARSATPISDFANVEFRNNRNNQFLMNGKIPFVIL
jgi:hypothetical protein